MTTETTTITACIETLKGTINLNLYAEQAPLTVANFVNLVERGYYNGLVFHRVIPDFMIQGGCPQGSGSGGPGYYFDDEFHPDLKHDRAGTLSMANAGPGTNGSQFFITHGPTEWLDQKHTVFGYVVKGQKIVDQVAQGDIIKSINIEYLGEDAKNWDAQLAFKEFIEKGEARSKSEQKLADEALDSVTKGMKKTKSGLFYNIIKEGLGPTPIKGSKVSVHYGGKLIDGTVFDSSYQRNKPIEFSLGIGKVIQGWDEGIKLMNKGASALFVIPSHLAYGKQGAGGVIPPNSTLIFEVELIDF